jgi:hypothetical protein
VKWPLTRRLPISGAPCCGVTNAALGCFQRLNAHVCTCHHATICHPSCMGDTPFSSSAGHHANMDPCTTAVCCCTCQVSHGCPQAMRNTENKQSLGVCSAWATSSERSQVRDLVQGAPHICTGGPHASARTQSLPCIRQTQGRCCPGCREPHPHPEACVHVGAVVWRWSCQTPWVPCHAELR